MELAIIRRETSGQGPNTYNESETITKFELMDGAPVKGEVIPIRYFCSEYNQYLHVYVSREFIFPGCFCLRWSSHRRTALFATLFL